jgi:integrase
VKKNLTERVVTMLSAPESGQRDYYDEKERGLVLRVSQGGSKTWYLVYRHRDSGLNRRMVLGRYPELGVAEVKRRASKLRGEIADGADPAARMQDQKTAETFRELSSLYLEKHAVNKRSRAEDVRILKHDLLPAWGRRKANEIKRRDVIHVLDGITTRGAGVMANRTRALIHKIFNFALGRDLVETNPCFGVERPLRTENRRDRVLTDDEIKSVWLALEEFPEKIASGFRFALITGQRRSEVLALRWAEVDLENSLWSIPAERSKNRMPHRVPLTPMALAILSSRKASLDSDAGHVFPGGKKSLPLLNLQKWESRLRDKTGVDFKFHDLRRTCATKLGDLSVHRDVISKILNHAEPHVSATYDRASRENEKRSALIRWDSKLGEIVTGEPASKVVNLFAAAS